MMGLQLLVLPLAFSPMRALHYHPWFTEWRIFIGVCKVVPEFSVLFAAQSVITHLVCWREDSKVSDTKRLAALHCMAFIKNVCRAVLLLADGWSPRAFSGAPCLTDLSFLFLMTFSCSAPCSLPSTYIPWSKRSLSWRSAPRNSRRFLHKALLER